jgi:putative ABC transport system permease protein
MIRRRGLFTPPKAAERIMAHILKDEVWQTPLGDFEEVYRSVAQERGAFRAELWYWGQILNLVPEKLLNILYWRLHMFRNDVKMAVRTIKKNKGYTFINMAGLAVGIASCLLILLFVQHELSYDRFHENADRIVRVGMKVTFGTNSFTIADGPAPLAAALKEDLPEVLDATRLFRIRQTYLKYEEKQFKEEEFFYADPNVFDIFTLPLISGDPKTVLSQPGTVVITPEAAEKYFGTLDVLGRVLEGENDQTFKVTGIIRPLPDNSHFTFDFLASALGHPHSTRLDWVDNGVFTYLLLDHTASTAQLEAKLPGLTKKYVEPTIQEGFGMSFDKFLETGNFFGYFPQRLLDIHLHSNVDNDLRTSGNYNTVLIFAAIALVILLVACINFTNLATARASKRANEVGVRKVVGSQKRQLVQQFLTESLLLSVAAFGIALVLVRIALPSFNKIMDKEISMLALGTWYIPPLLIGFAVFIGILAGVYPAFMLASFRPVAVLKGKMQSGSRQRRFRNALVVFQFFATVTLFIITIVIFNQLHFMRNKDMGFDQEQIVIIQNARALGSQQEAFRTTLKQNPDILTAAYSDTGPFMSLAAQVYRKEGQDVQTNYTLVNIQVDYDYMETYRFLMKEGRFFAKENSTDTTAVILNEAAVHAMGLQEPILGQQLLLLSDEGTSFTIIGIVKDFHVQSLHEAIRPMVLTLEQDPPIRLLSIRLGPGKIEQTMGFIEEQWKAFNPPQPIDTTFLDERFDRAYRTEVQTGNVFTAFAVLAILIACLGLFGLASFMAEQKTKEIGVRKVMGATIPGIVLLLSKEYVKWLVVANLFAWPLAYYTMIKWLENFAFRSSLTVWPFLLAGTAALIIALITVSYQSLKAALSHPIKCLRYE